MSSLKDIDRISNDDSTSNNIKSEFNALMELENRTKRGFRCRAFTFSGDVKTIKNNLK